jgi:hypothetical protein
MVRAICIVEHGHGEVQVDQRRLNDIAVRTCQPYSNEICMRASKPAYGEPESGKGFFLHLSAWTGRAAGELSVAEIDSFMTPRRG